MPKLSQESIAMPGIGIGLAALISMWNQSESTEAAPEG